MKRQTLYELIKAHFTNDRKQFLSLAKQIATQLSDLGDKSLAAAINQLIRSHSQLTLSRVIAQYQAFSIKK